MHWLGALRPHEAHGDTTCRANYPLILEPPRGCSETAQSADVNVRQLTQIIGLVGTWMSVSRST